MSIEDQVRTIRAQIKEMDIKEVRVLLVVLQQDIEARESEQSKAPAAKASKPSMKRTSRASKTAATNEVKSPATA